MNKSELRLKGEFEPQRAVLMLIPYRKDIWRADCKPITDMIVKLANTASKFQSVVLGVLPDILPKIENEYKFSDNVKLVPFMYNDAWPRDSVSSVLVGDDKKIISGFGFNAYGDGLYKPWNYDATLNEQVANFFGYDLEKTSLVLEGGNIAPDGNGTLFAVKDCLVNENRNPNMSLQEAEDLLKKATRCKQIIWLEHGLEFDETGGHIDNVMAFADKHTIVLSWTDDKTNPHYLRTHEIYEQLKSVVNVDGQPYQIVKLVVPPPSKRTEEECIGIEQNDDSFARRAGDDVLDTYVNFAIVNGAVIVPQFGTDLDEVALSTLKTVFSDRQIVPFYSREASLGGGGLHCLTKHIN